MKIKDLDPTKAYDIKHLNREQKIAVYDWLVKNDLNWEGIYKRDFAKIHKDFLIYDGVEWDWLSENDIDENQVITNALELFEEEEPMYIEVRYNEVKPSVFINNSNEDITINIKVPANQKVIISYEQL